MISDVAPGKAGPRRTTTCGLFPFGLGWEPIAIGTPADRDRRRGPDPVDMEGKPRRIGVVHGHQSFFEAAGVAPFDGLMPGQTDHGMIQSLSSFGRKVSESVRTAPCPHFLPLRQRGFPLLTEKSTDMHRDRRSIGIRVSTRAPHRIESTRNQGKSRRHRRFPGPIVHGNPESHLRRHTAQPIGTGIPDDLFPGASLYPGTNVAGGTGHGNLPDLAAVRRGLEHDPDQ